MIDDPMKLLTDIVFGKKVPSESWEEYQKNGEQSAQYHHINYGQARGTEGENQIRD